MLRRILSLLALTMALFLSAVTGALAQDGPQLEAEVVVAVDVPEPAPEASLVIQATSWPGETHAYIVTITNLSPWPIPALSFVDRYLPTDDVDEEEIHEWYPGPIMSFDSVSRAIQLEHLWPDACHQLELSLADGLGIVLMDCDGAGAMTLWNIPLSDEMAGHLGQLPLTEPEPFGSSKVGIHVTRNSSPTIMEFVRETQPAVVAAVGDLGWLSEVKELSPSTVTIGRVIEGDQSFDGDPVERARAFVESNHEAYVVNRGVDYWLGWNEPVIDELWQAEWYAAFEAERVIAMNELGFATAIGNFSVGTPESDEFEAFLPALVVARDHGAILALHEYSAPTMFSGQGAGIPGIEGGADTGALTLRYRYWYEHFLRAHDLVVPLVITEAGIDGGVLKLEDQSLLGWRDFAEDAGGLPETIAVDRRETYLEQLSWYDDQLRRDPYVIGFAIFNVGDEQGDWESFDVTSLLPELSGMAATKN